MNNVCNVFTNSDIVVVGDFILPGIQWSCDDEDVVGFWPSDLSTTQGIIICDGFCVLSFSQFNYVTNMAGNILDLFFQL